MIYVLIATFFLAPAYAIRFSFFGLPTNALMVWIFLFWFMFAIWLWRDRRVSDFNHSVKSLKKNIFTLVALFFLAGLISLFVGGVTMSKIGQFIVWFLQPISFFFITRYLVSRSAASRQLFLQSFYIFVGLAGLYAVMQYFTLLGLPTDWWGNSNEPKRAISFFSHPNGYALFVTPLLAFLLPHAASLLRNIKKNWLQLVLYILGGIGLLLSLSRGGWFGLAAAAALFLVLKADKKLWQVALPVVVIVMVIIVSVPNFRYRLLLPFYGEKSSVARLSLWNTGWHMVKDSPVLGKGLTGFNTNWYNYNTDNGLEHYNFPHNIFLNFWIDTGLLGLLSFITLCVYGILRGLVRPTNVMSLGLTLFLVALIVHGLIDIPYFKNDLALVFWLVWGLV